MELRLEKKKNSRWTMQACAGVGAGPGTTARDSDEKWFCGSCLTLDAGPAEEVSESKGPLGLPS